jgi:hypothetical protein
LLSVGTVATLPGWNRVAAAAGNDERSIYPAKRNEQYVLDRPLTE